MYYFSEYSIPVKRPCCQTTLDLSSLRLSGLPSERDGADDAMATISAPSFGVLTTRIGTTSDFRLFVVRGGPQADRGAEPSLSRSLGLGGGGGGTRVSE